MRRTGASLDEVVNARSARKGFSVSFLDLRRLEEFVINLFYMRT
jgi:hypothetical protein